MNIDLENSEIDRIAQRVVQKLSTLFKLPKPEKENLKTVEQLADYLQVKNQWIYERVKNNEIPFIKVGRFIRFKKEEIDQWIKERETPAISPFSGSLKSLKIGKPAN